MSDDFHVHGPHDHEIEHVSHHHAHAFANQIAVTTAILATIGALYSYMGGATQANAMLYKNNAAIAKTEASDQWNYYQAKSNRQNLNLLALDLLPENKRVSYEKMARRYDQEKEQIKSKAEKLEKDAVEWNRRSDEQMHLHHRWAQATTIIQVAISMAAISLLTRKRWLEWLMWGLSGVGIVSGVFALLAL
jgi:hypothetical protein